MLAPGLQHIVCAKMWQGDKKNTESKNSIFDLFLVKFMLRLLCLNATRRMQSIWSTIRSYGKWTMDFKFEFEGQCGTLILTSSTTFEFILVRFVFELRHLIIIYNHVCVCVCAAQSHNNCLFFSLNARSFPVSQISFVNQIATRKCTTNKKKRN